jgi:hypothetical protein
MAARLDAASHHLLTCVRRFDESGDWHRRRHQRGFVISDGTFAAETYRRAVFRSMPAFIAACPMCPSLLISSINRLTCASVTGLKAPPTRFSGRRLPTYHLRRSGWGDVVVADGEM